MYHTEPPTDKTIREWYMNSSRVAACALRNEQAVRAHGPGRHVIKCNKTQRNNGVLRAVLKGKYYVVNRTNLVHKFS